MGKTLILMRHGKAQSRETEIPDEQRHLTRAGKRALAATLPHNLGLWDAQDDAVIWTSPALRCSQTADILHGALSSKKAGLPTPEAQRCLFDQDLETFLAKLDAADEQCVVCVGHNPFIEETAALLSGNQMRFLPGAFAAFEIPCSADQPLAQTLDQARLLWFVQGVSVEPWKVLVELEDVMRDAHRHMVERYEAALGDSDDVETIHKLRVSIRTMRSLFKFLVPFHNAKAATMVQRDLRSLVLPTSRLREYDVLKAAAQDMQPPSAELMAVCDELRAQERDLTIAALTSEDAKKALARIEKAVKRFRWKRSVERRGLQRSDVSARFAALDATVERHLANADLANVEATHDVRKEAKRVRYAAEHFATFLDEAFAETVVARMKAAQDNLGALCDARVNVDIIGEFPRAQLTEQAQRDLDALDAQNRFFIATKLREAAEPTA